MSGTGDDAWHTAEPAINRGPNRGKPRERGSEEKFRHFVAMDQTYGDCFPGAYATRLENSAAARLCDDWQQCVISLSEEELRRKFSSWSLGLAVKTFPILAAGATFGRPAGYQFVGLSGLTP